MGMEFGGGITIGPGISIVTSEQIGIYRIIPGTKLPVLGVAGQSPFPATGWTSIISASGDDANTQVNFGFTWKYNSVNYTSFFPNSNYYISFGTGSNQFNALANNSPAINKIFFAGADNSWQRVSRIASGTDYLRLRWEGTSSTSGTPGSPNMVYEITFFNSINTANVPVFELLIGRQNRGTTSAISGLYSNTALLTGGSLGPTNRGVSANQSYVAVGDANGASWNVYTGYYLSGTGY
jgi:hypothetical protein